MTFLKIFISLFFITSLLQRPVFSDQKVPVNEVEDSDENDEEEDEDVIILEEDVDDEEPNN